MKINILFIIIVLSYSCNTISESEKLEEYGEYLGQFESYEYDVSQQMYQYATDKTSRRSATAYFSEDPNDSILEIDYYIALEANGSSYISFYNEGIETSLNLNDSMAYTKHLSLYPANKRMTNPIAIYSFHSIKKWIEKNSRDSTFKNLVLKDTIIDGKKCDLFSYNIDFKEHAYWYNFPKKTVNRTVNSVNIAFSKESQLPVYLSCRENFSSKNYIVEKSWFSNFHQTHYNKQKLSEESVPNYFHWYNGGNMLPLNSILPNFILPTLTGDSITLSDLRGKYVLIEFSYIGCGPCIKSIPKLNNIQNMYADKCNSPLALRT
jgi:hypothetical protein